MSRKTPVFGIAVMVTVGLAALGIAALGRANVLRLSGAALASMSFFADLASGNDAHTAAGKALTTAPPTAREGLAVPSAAAATRPVASVSPAPAGSVTSSAPSAIPPSAPAPVVAQNSSVEVGIPAGAPGTEIRTGGDSSSAPLQVVVPAAPGSRVVVPVTNAAPPSAPAAAPSAEPVPVAAPKAAPVRKTKKPVDDIDQIPPLDCRTHRCTR